MTAASASTASDRAYSVVRDAIAAGQYPVGTPLREGLLAQKAGISRTPIREALRRLDAEGLVELLPNRGARVVAWNLHDVEEIFELRVLLEGFGPRLAARNAGKTELAELAWLCEEMSAETSKRKVQFRRIAEINSGFHRGIMSASGNRRLASVAAGVVDPALMLRTFHLYSPEHWLGPQPIIGSLSMP